MIRFIEDFPGTWEQLAHTRDDYALDRGINIMWDTLNDELAARGL